jgi:hypothetical protein
LEKEVNGLQQENKRLKEESLKSESGSKLHEPIPIFHQAPNINLYEGEGGYDPYRIKYHSNDMGRLKDKGFKKENPSQISHKFTPIAEVDENRNRDRIDL